MAGRALLTSRGLSTSPMPHGAPHFSIDFDFIDHRLVIRASDGARSDFALVPMAVAEFHRELMGRLDALGLSVTITTLPNETPIRFPFEKDTVHASYDADAAHRFWRALLQSAHVLHAFRSSFIGKVSPVHFFWGSFDLAVTRFSGRTAPPHPGGVPGLADWVVREAYSHEVSSCGFWPGNGGFGEAAFYCYAYPEPPGFADTDAGALSAYYDKKLREFILPYEAVRQGGDALLLGFLQSTYAAAADNAHGTAMRWNVTVETHRENPAQGDVCLRIVRLLCVQPIRARRRRPGSERDAGTLPQHDVFQLTP